MRTGARRRRDAGAARQSDKEPHNWLMNHRTYDAQRYSPLARINKDNVKSLKLAYAVPIGGTAINENLQATPLVEDGYHLHRRRLGRRSTRSTCAPATMGRIVWRMDPKQEKVPLSNRGAALWGNLVISVASYPPRIDRHRQGHRQGRVGDQPRRRADRPAAHRRAARGQGQDHHRRRRRRPRRARLDRRRSTPRPASCCGAIHRSRRRASRAARPGRTRTTPGRPAAAPCG